MTPRCSCATGQPTGHQEDSTALLSGLPLPQGGSSCLPPRAAGYATLDSSKERRLNYDLFLGSERESSVAYSPVKMDLENVSRCNLGVQMPSERLERAATKPQI